MTYELRISRKAVTLDGEAVAVEGDADPYRAGLNAAHAAAARDLPTGAPAFVHAVSEQGEWHLVLRDGAAHVRPRPGSAPAASVASSLTATPPRDRTVTRRALLGGGVGVLAVAALGAALMPTEPHNAPPSPRQAAPSVPSLPDGQEVPSGWSSTPTWAIEGVTDAKPSLAVHDTTVVVATQPAGTGRVRLVAVNAENGRRVWNADLASGAIVTAGPLMLARDQRRVAIVATEDELLGWDTADGRLTLSVKLPRHGARVSATPLGVWVEDTRNTLFGLGSKELKRYEIPKDAQPLGMVGEQMVAASNDGHVWKLTSGKKPGKPTTLSGPKGYSAGAPVIVTRDLFAVGWNKDGAVALRAYTLDSLKEAWTSSDETGLHAFMGLCTVTPSEQWAVVDNRLVDLHTGHTRTLASRWTTTTISDTYAWGSDGRTVLTSTASGEILPAKPSTTGASPITLSGGAAGRLIVTGSVDNDHTLYALPAL